MQASDLETFVVTGASSGIGRELAIQLAAPGRVIWVIARDRKRLAEVADLIRLKGAVANVGEIDLADLETSQRFLNENFPEGSPVNEVYLAAAVTLFGEVKDTLPEDWDLIYRTNLLSPVQWTRHFYAKMVTQKLGKIVLISSLAAYSGYPMATSYSTMKAGLLGLYRSLMPEGKSHGVAIHIASPGYVDTGIYKAATFRKTTYKKTMEEIESLGFGILPSSVVAKRILRSVERGHREFALPAYASLMKWCSPRLPFLMDHVHRKMVRKFRQSL